MIFKSGCLQTLGFGLIGFRCRTDKPKENANSFAFDHCPMAYVGTSSGEVCL